MNKKFSLIMITIWSVIALALIGVIVTFIVMGGFHFSGWNFNFGGSTGKYTQFVDKSYDSSNINQIKLKVSSANVNFSKTQGTEIKVDIAGNDVSSSSSDKDLYTVTQNGSDLEITQNYDWWRFAFFNFGGSNQRINITLPESYKKDLNLSLTSGDIKFDGDYTFANASIYKTSGDIISGAIKADNFTFQTTSGDANIAALDAKYDISSTSGDTKIGSLSGSGRIHSISGSMLLDVARLDGSLDISATSGDMTIGLDKAVNAEISGNATSGDINANFAMNYSGRGRNHASATIGTSPYNNISVSVISGDVTFNQN
jgi:lia operon protein LiaG